MSTKQTILVIGATGKQGSAVVKALDKSKFKILAATRDASSEKARALGVDFVEGSLDSPDTLFKEPIHGVFVALGEPDAEEQLKQGLAIADAAAKHGVKHFVYSGSDRCGLKPTGIRFFDIKEEIEAHIKTKPFQWTILGPVGFYENFYWPLYLDQVSTTWKHAAHPTYKLIAVEDIGKIAAEAFAKPEQLAGKQLNIAGEELTPDEIIEIWREVTGQTLQAQETPVFPPMFAPAFKFFDDNQFAADVAETRRLFPFMTDLKSWLEKTPFAKK
ncbi:hypothetical protein I302_102539 [Kwoniella bestiolae CBS 10118]|uniref:NmrA-like domain-containing protein n=1 Tax=Kwoniella bestiolae CBS 10118 TaxID=1296100 RepID=A0A1B9GFG9_9TREE|nr:hypothetical protein I302_01227 [Kwoniella bestiolae CBS 10118]OCF29715.1 hypothetical protein I302_01227 [Kwoniella bestiolae CBS 10118]